MPIRLLVVASTEDPVARGMLERWGEPSTTGLEVEGEPVRELAPGIGLVRRAVPHIHDEHLEAKLPVELRDPGIPILFPSIHRSAGGPRCFTVHPLGNLGRTAEVGGTPRTLTPSAPRWMAAALREVARRAPAVGLPTTFEATHHGPALEMPAFFVELGGGPDPESPAPDGLDVLAQAIPRLEPDPADRVALAVGGGHYAPHFTELVLERHWAFGHMIPRHALEDLTAAVAAEAWRKTPEAEGVLFARAADSQMPALVDLGPRLRDIDSPRRDPLPPLS